MDPSSHSERHRSCALAPSPRPPPQVKSSEELELETMAAAPKFRARPVSAKVWRRAWIRLREFAEAASSCSSTD